MSSLGAGGALRTRPALAVLLASALVAACSWSVPARANGRFPAAFQLVQDPNDPAHLVAQVTYGLVSTRDGGGTWLWTCERAMGFIGAFDPPIAIAEDGVVFAAMFDGLGRATPDGCDWSFVGGPAAGRYSVDVSVSRSDPSVVVALTTDSLGDGRFEAHLMRSADDGGSFVDVGDPFPEDFLGVTLDIAPSDPDRIYVTGFFARGDNVYEGAFGRSLDGGETFELSLIEGSDAATGPFLGAVHPTDPDVAFVRLAGPAGRLLRTADGGDTWGELFQAEGALLGFALSPDGGTLVFGGEADPIRRGPSDVGPFEVVSELRPRCLSWFGDSVFACGSEATDGFTIGLSVDVAETFTPLYSRFCTSGPLECPDGTSIGTICPAEWEVLRDSISADACFGSGGSEAASTVTSSGDGVSAASTSEVAAASGAGGGASSGDSESSSGCCSVAGRSASGRPAGTALLAAGVALFARRRARRQKPGTFACNTPPHLP